MFSDLRIESNLRIGEIEIERIYGLKMKNGGERINKTGIFFVMVAES